MRRGETTSTRWGAAAAVAAFAFAAVSIYWGLGGTAGLSTLGGEVEERWRSGDAVLRWANWVAVALKLAGGMLALALVQPWGRRLPRRPVRALAWAGAVVLVLYGAAQTGAVLLLHLGIVTTEPPVSPDVIRWRLLLWEPWFLLWGLLLTATLLSSRRASDHPGTRGLR